MSIPIHPVVGLLFSSLSYYPDPQSVPATTVFSKPAVAEYHRAMCPGSRHFDRTVKLRIELVVGVRAEQFGRPMQLFVFPRSQSLFSYLCSKVVLHGYDASLGSKKLPWAIRVWLVAPLAAFIIVKSKSTKPFRTQQS